MELRNRNKHQLKTDAAEICQDKEDKFEEKLFFNTKLMLKFVTVIFSFTLCFFLSKYYTAYIKMLHENYFWFSNIKVSTKNENLIL